MWKIWCSYACTLWNSVGEFTSIGFILTISCFLRIDLPSSRFPKEGWSLSESLPKEIALYTYIASDNLTAICVSRLSRKCGSLDVSQPYGRISQETVYHWRCAMDSQKTEFLWCPTVLMRPRHVRTLTSGTNERDGMGWDGMEIRKQRKWGGFQLNFQRALFTGGVCLTDFVHGT
jgi:hypothetical protein